MIIQMVDVKVVIGGSNYGHEIQIREITQNEKWLEQLVGKNIYKD